MPLEWIVLIIHLVRCYGYISNNCGFNSMCTCFADQLDQHSRVIHSVSCLSVPFYKFPSFPEDSSISQLEIAGSKTAILEAESLAGCQVQALVLTNNQLQHVAERAFSYSWKSLTSLDLSYNQLDGVPFDALKELRSLQWLNLHGNQVSSIAGEWSHMKTTVGTLFLGENDITEIPNDPPDPITNSEHGLRQFKSLVWLNLDGNRIHKIHKHSLPSTLQTASVSHNLIENFPLEIVANLPRLQWLYLRGNHIRNLPEYTFARRLWLEKIDLGENYLKSLPRNPFNRSVNVRDLNLAFNDFKTLANDTFSGLQTGRIILSYNSLEEIEPDSFNGIEHTLEYLDLDHNNLNYIPEAIVQLHSLKYLYLSSNSLREIPDQAFEKFCPSLKALSLSGNQLTKVPSSSLGNCSRISHFNIAFNEIYEVNGEEFADWGRNIRCLIFSNNRLTTLKTKTFSYLTELRELSLSFNPLRVFEKDAFLGLDHLESLELSFAFDNGDFPFEVFLPLDNLKWLTVDHNNFHMVPESSLDSLSELKYLNMEFNKIQAVPVKLFKASVHLKLESVQLSNNEISIIETGTFRSLPSLETIFLSGNKISHIQQHAFDDLKNLNKLILSNNFLTHITHAAFVNIPNLSKLDLQDNLLTSISFGSFVNTSGPLILNISRNQISACEADSKILNVETIDLRYNNLNRVPNCLSHTASLKNLYMDYNIISNLDHNGFMHLTSLEHLSLEQNNINFVSRRAFFGLQNLQILNLSKNLIAQLHTTQFENMLKLRILDLSENSLNYLSKDIFSSTSLEKLDLTSNSFAVVPSLSISDITTSLRFLSMRSNNIEHIDITTFPDIPQLQHLDLSNNKLSILPDNVFTSLGLLQNLDLSFNPLRANFKELFHYAQRLKVLNLANTRLNVAPHFPLPNLVRLNLSHNLIQTLNKNSVQDLVKLKVLDLSFNEISHVPSHVWINLPSLKKLDLSNNPIKQIIVDSFQNLPNLQVINLQHLKHLNRFESKALLQLKVLSELSFQTWPNVDHFYEQFCHLLSHIHPLRILRIYFAETSLDDQLLCNTNRKIRHLEITGRNLRSVDRNAFAKFARNPDLVVKIHGTQIEDLPPGLFSNMYTVSYLTVDLRNNMISYLNPESFYGNSTTWKNVGTTLMSGGLFVAGNPIRCGCHLAWFGHWLRRWTRESMQAHSTPVETTQRIDELVRESTCIDSGSGNRIPIVLLPQEDLSCHPSALSGNSQSNRNPVVFYLSLLFVCVVTVNHVTCW